LPAPASRQPILTRAMVRPVLPLQARALETPQRPATPDVEIRDVAVIEPRWYQPWLASTAQLQLLDCQGEFLVLA
jgi:hypothetical protein